jgi:tRNA modification GTPase
LGDQPASRSWHEGSLSLPGIASPLPADLYFWPGPRSYTGQDMVELHTLASPPLVNHLISELLDAGARGARPGEFTMRAFLAGKLDLTRAEAVVGIIEASNQDELRQALVQLAGGMSRPLQELREDLLNLLADIEAGLDFAGEDISFASPEEMLHRLARALAQVTLVLKQFEHRGLAGRAFRVTFTGRPNAGKSSLFNVLSGSDAALVSAQPGTTRDYLVRAINLEGMPIELIDTAGVSQQADVIGKQAQSLGTGQRATANLVLLCLEADRAPTREEEDLLHQRAPAVIGVGTKCDLGLPPPGWLATSAVTGAGIAALRTLLAEHARMDNRPAMAPSLSRCRHHVTTCLTHLRQAHGIVLNEEPPELLAAELRGALDQLGEMVGAVYTDDLLDRIFSRFCIGK